MRRSRRSQRDGVRPPGVLIIAQNVPVPFDRRVWLEAQALKDAGYDVSVVCPKAEVTLGTGARRCPLYKYRPSPPTLAKLGFVV